MNAISLPLSLSLTSIWDQLKQLELGFSAEMWLIWLWCKRGESTHSSHPTLLCWVSHAFGCTHTHTHTHSWLWETLNHEDSWSLQVIIGVQLFKFRHQKTEAQRGQIKCSSSPAGSRSPEVIAQSPCPSVWPCGVEGTGTYESEYQLSCFPTKWASLSPFPTPKVGQASSTPRAGSWEGSCIAKLSTVPRGSRLREMLASPWPLFSVPLCWCSLAWIWRRCSGQGQSPSGHSLDTSPDPQTKKGTL